MSNIEFKTFLENLLKFMNDKAKSNEVRVNIPHKRGVKYTSYTLKSFIELELEKLK